MTINGTMAQAAFTVVSAPVMVPSWCSTRAHWIEKLTSATVATERPTTTLDSHVSNRQMR